MSNSAGTSFDSSTESLWRKGLRDTATNRSFYDYFGYFGW
jgi:hypothetical protein